MPFPEEVVPAVLLERRSIFIESEAPSIHSWPLVALDQARDFLAVAPCCGDKGMRLVQLLREIYLDQPQRLPDVRLDRFLLLLGSGLLPRPLFRIGCRKVNSDIALRGEQRGLGWILASLDLVPVPPWRHRN